MWSASESRALEAHPAADASIGQQNRGADDNSSANRTLMHVHRIVCHFGAANLGESGGEALHAGGTNLRGAHNSAMSTVAALPRSIVLHVSGTGLFASIAGDIPLGIGPLHDKAC